MSFFKYMEKSITPTSKFQKQKLLIIFCKMSCLCFKLPQTSNTLARIKWAFSLSRNLNVSEFSCSLFYVIANLFGFYWIWPEENEDILKHQPDIREIVLGSELSLFFIRYWCRLSITNCVTWLLPRWIHKMANNFTFSDQTQKISSHNSSVLHSFFILIVFTYRLQIKFERWRLLYQFHRVINQSQSQCKNNLHKLFVLM